MEATVQALREDLRAAIDAEGASLERAAREIGVAVVTLWNFLNGSWGNPQTGHLQAYAAFAESVLGPREYARRFDAEAVRAEMRKRIGYVGAGRRSGIPLKDVAEQIGVNKKTLARFLSGEEATPRFETLETYRAWVESRPEKPPRPKKASSKPAIGKSASRRLQQRRDADALRGELREALGYVGGGRRGGIALVDAAAEIGVCTATLCKFLSSDNWIPRPASAEKFNAYLQRRRNEAAARAAEARLVEDLREELGWQEDDGAIACPPDWAAARIGIDEDDLWRMVSKGTLGAGAAAAWVWLEPRREAGRAPLWAGYLLEVATPAWMLEGDALRDAVETEYCEWGEHWGVPEALPGGLPAFEAWLSGDAMPWEWMRELRIGMGFAQEWLYDCETMAEYAAKRAKFALPAAA